MLINQINDNINAMVRKKAVIFILCATFIIIFLTFIFLDISYAKAHKGLNVILITIDALRPDHLSCYGYKRNTSPNIDEFAKEGTLFTQAISAGTKTWTSVTSLISSTYFLKHKIYREDQTLSALIVTLPEILKKEGYRTCFISGHGGIRIYDKFRIKQAFDIFNITSHNHADKITRKSLKWLGKNKDNKFFLWLHYFEPHGPYLPPGKYKTKYLKDDLYIPDKHIQIAPHNYADIGPKKKYTGKGKIPEYVAEKGITDISYYIAEYDGEISFVDEQVGILLKMIKEWNLDRDTLIVITADHGEYLGEHNFYFKHCYLHDEVIKVPLIMRCEGIIPANKTVGQQVSLVDIMPTILSIIKIKPNIKMSGFNLLPLIFNKSYNNFYVFSEFMDTPGVYLISVRTNQWKLIYDALENMYELYDLKRDPKESIDLAGTQTRKFRSLRAELRKWMNSQKSNAFFGHIETDEKAVLSDEDKEYLRSLGYVQ